jgi:putative tricarboxylic transport membrane protein
MRAWQIGFALAVLALAAAYGMGVSGFPAETGYAGIGSRFFPSLVTGLLAVVGTALLWQSLSGGYRAFEDGEAGITPEWGAAAWVAGGILLHAALITRIGFVLSSTMLFVFAARGFGSARPLRDVIVGAVVTLPVFWLFTKMLDISLPKLINSWL